MSDDDAPRSLGMARIALGAVFVFRTTPLANYYPSPLCWVDGPLFGWPAAGWHAAWLRLAFPPHVVAALCIVRTIAVGLFALGLATRAAGLAAAACAFAVLAQDTFAFSFTRYILFLGTGLLAMADGGGALALRPSRVADGPASRSLIRAFVVSIYAWSALAKLRWGWITGRTIDALHAGHFLHGPLIDFVTRTASMRAVASVSVVLWELSLGPLLLIRRTRAFGLAAALLMHGVYEVCAQPDVMGLVMASLLCVFLPAPARPCSDARAHPLDSHIHQAHSSANVADTLPNPVDAHANLLDASANVVHSHAHAVDARIHPAHSRAHPLDAGVHPAH